MTFILRVMFIKVMVHKMCVDLPLKVGAVVAFQKNPSCSCLHCCEHLPHKFSDHHLPGLTSNLKIKTNSWFYPNFQQWYVSQSIASEEKMKQPTHFFLFFIPGGSCPHIHKSSPTLHPHLSFVQVSKHLTSKLIFCSIATKQLFW